MEKYPSGSRGSPAKGVVWVDRSEGSNPSFSAKKTDNLLVNGLFACQVCKEGFELGASEQSERACRRQENSPVDCFAGGSREASPPLCKFKKTPDTQKGIGSFCGSR